MIGLVIFWSVHDWIKAHKSATKRWLSLFTYPLRTYGGTHFFIINPKQDKIEYQPHDLIYKEYSDLKELLEEYSDVNYVALTSKGDLLLKNYIHPKEDIIYVTGSDYGDLFKEMFLGYKTDFIKITCGNIPLWANQASTIALYDRAVKHGINGN